MMAIKATVMFLPQEKYASACSKDPERRKDEKSYSFAVLRYKWTVQEEKSIDISSYRYKKLMEVVLCKG